MFGLGRRKDHEIKRLQEWGEQLGKQLEQAQQDLHDANKRAETAESKANTLATMNRALAAKTHRLELQRMELEGEKDRILRENKELQVTNLQAQNEARMAKVAGSDGWEVTNLKLALRRQAAQHESKLASFKRRTKALLSAVLPAAHGRGASRAAPAEASRSAPGSPTAASPLPDLWDAPLYAPAQLESEPHDVHGQVRQIIGWLYDDTITEDQALEQISTLTQGMALQPMRLEPQVQAESRGCSPLPALRFSQSAPGDSGGAEMVDTGTDPHTARPQRLMADVATETPAELSYVGSPRDTAAPSVAGTPARRLGPAVPALDLAALVAQAMEVAPLSGRSTASTTAAGSYSQASSFNAFSHFVLAQPEKLQRLIMRHAAATGALGKQQAQQSPLPAGMLSSAAAATAATTDFPAAASLAKTSIGAASSLDAPTVPANARPNFTRLLGLGTSSNVNRPTAPAPSAAPATANSTATAGVVLPSANAATMAAEASKPAPSKRPNAPKFAGVPAVTPAVPASSAAPAAGGAPSGLSFPQLMMPTLPSVKPVSPELRGLGAGGFTGRGALEAETEFKELFGGDSSSSGALVLGKAR